MCNVATIMTTISNSYDEEERDSPYVIELSRRQHAQVMEKMEKVVESLRNIQLVPVTLIFVLSSGYFFYIDKLPVWMWGLMQLVIMTPHFGEGVKMIIPLFFKGPAKA